MLAAGAIYISTLFSSLVAVSNQNLNTVHLIDGSPVVGTLVQGVADAAPVVQFLGIPFAETPVGENRFKKPLPKSPWTEVLHSKAPPACIQLKEATTKMNNWWWSNITDMQEDCLYLNVWTPNSPEPEAKLAVMVWIHGGYFTSGSSHSEGLYNGRMLASQEGVVVVSIQYRLGIFGFASGDTDSEFIPGNAGLWDQALAIKWVQRNIERFGGAPDRVTLFGQSAGAASVGLQMVSHVSRPNFARAIMQSGSPIALWAVLSNELVESHTIQTAQKVGCYDGKVNLTCLNKVDATELYENSFFGAFISWGPIIDGKFLQGPVINRLLNADVKNGSFLLGHNKREFNHLFPKFLPYIYSIEKIFNSSKIIRTDEQFYQILETFSNTVFPGSDESFKEELNSLYPINASSRENVLEEICADPTFNCPVYLTAFILSKLLNQTTFMYNFDYHSNTFSTPEWMGAMHGDELPFTFGLPLKSELNGIFSEDEKKLSQILMKYLATFAKRG